MKKIRAKVQEYHSMKEYEERFYPESYKKQSLEVSDPNEIGAILAEEMLNKFKHLMRKQKLCI
ncbi:hypothetical protein KsCSTR_01120 [Candidatus Kuenenia stuttgartiensis]|uniref:Uncharacterized protein n=1 Tax=Kuenenia stuttgartiensis TaxID=174633 RepID=A0A6G7GJ94_KUEST|nr:hypothetical protein [Candidatus Kuenenia stuttgartiensis]QII09491.1 hypothetical protein KsCSTR_01120 [Candidatus Kuenenia stuttgartiensis]